jgi:hypothetical protein
MKKAAYPSGISGWFIYVYARLFFPDRYRMICGMRADMLFCVRGNNGSCGYGFVQSHDTALLPVKYWDDYTTAA